MLSGDQDGEFDPTLAHGFEQRLDHAAVGKKIRRGDVRNERTLEELERI
jgi:hypothetical protein